MLARVDVLSTVEGGLQVNKKRCDRPLRHSSGSVFVLRKLFPMALQWSSHHEMNIGRLQSMPQTSLRFHEEKKRIKQRGSEEGWRAKVKLLRTQSLAKEIQMTQTPDTPRGSLLREKRKQAWRDGHQHQLCWWWQRKPSV